MGLVDVIVGIGLMLTIFLALFAALRVALELATIAKAKAVAAELATTQMEYLRNLSYASIGNVGGNPVGTIPLYATSTLASGTFVTRTLITAIDDPADGTDQHDANHVTADYKKVKVTVSYTIHGRTGNVILVSNYVPDGIEQ